MVKSRLIKPLVSILYSEIGDNMDNPIKQFNEIVFPNLDESQKADFNRATNVISSYSGEEFENFILEWLKYCRNKLQANTLISRIGGTGDNGIDIFENTDGRITYYQCKKYTHALTFPQVRQIIIKVLWHTFKEHIDSPYELYIIAFKGINGPAARGFSDKHKLKESLLKNCYSDLKSIDIIDDYTGFYEYLDALNDLNFIKKIDLDDIVKEYCMSDYAVFRFVTTKDIRLNRIQAPQRVYDADPFILQLNTIIHRHKQKVIQNAKEQYYSAICLEETDKYLYGSNQEFLKLKKEVSTTIDIIRSRHFDDMQERYLSILETAYNTDASNVSLQYNLHMVSAQDKAGICHVMVNEGELSWEEEDE